MGNYLEISNLKVNYKTFEGSTPVLDIDKLVIEKGKTFGIVGESGAGKTVLALTIQGLLSCPPGEILSGEILLDGVDVLKKTYKELEKIRGTKVSMIFQDPMSALNPVFTVGDQMAKIVMEKHKTKRKEAERRSIEMIQKVKLPDPEEIMKKYPHELSGGQRQRIIIGMALLCGAEFIIADEPTRNLDVTIQAGILKLIRELQQEFHVTVLYIANNLGLVAATCDEMGILKDGKIIEMGDAREVLRNPKEDYTKLLIQAVTTNRASTRAHDDLSRQPDILRVDGLKKYFPVKNEFASRKNTFVKAVDDVDFSIKKGEIIGIVGESGCGKSTLVNTILFLHPPTEGKVVFDGQDIFALGKQELRKARKDVQIVFQDPFWSLNPRWIVRDIIGEPLRVHKKMKASERLSTIQSLMQMVGLNPEDVFKYPHEFSGGQRQRIAIARALSVQPKLVVLDEPTSAIDVVSQAQILKLLLDLKEKMFLTYIIISHDIAVVNYMSDKIMVMYLGKIVEYGDAVYSNPKHPYTVALFNAIPGVDTTSVDQLAAIQGEVPSAINPPKGCRFHPRCPRCMDICREVEPEITFVEQRQVACHLYNEE